MRRICGTGYWLHAVRFIRWHCALKDASGAAEVYFGLAVQPWREGQSIKTVPGKDWFTYARFYSPTEAFFNQTGKPDDIVEMN
jgi:hypothetical protein